MNNTNKADKEPHQKKYTVKQQNVLPNIAHDIEELKGNAVPIGKLNMEEEGIDLPKAILFYSQFVLKGIKGIQLGIGSS